MQGWDSGPREIRRLRHRSGGRSARLIGGLLEGRSDLRSGWRGGEGGRPGKAARTAAGKKRLLRFRLRAQSPPRCFARMLRIRFATRLREPNETPALRGRFRECDAAPRRERMFHVKHFSASKAEGGGGIARAKRVRGRGKAGLPMCERMFHVKHPVQVGRDAMVQAGRNAVVRLQTS